jgi:hypothetical protein
MTDIIKALEKQKEMETINFHKTHDVIPTRNLPMCKKCKHTDPSRLNEFCPVWDSERKNIDHVHFLEQQIREKTETVRCLEGKVAAYKREREESTDTIRYLEEKVADYKQREESVQSLPAEDTAEVTSIEVSVAQFAKELIGAYERGRLGRTV